MTPFYHRPWRCLGSVCTVPSCTAQYIHNHRSLVVVPRGETPGLFPPRYMAPFSPLTSPHQPLSYLPAFPLLSRPALVSYHRLLGLGRPVTTFTFTSSRYFSLLGHIHTCTPPPRKGSTVHMSVLTCGHLCIRTHLRTHILSDTSSYPILHTHFTHKPRFKFPTSRGRGLIPEVRMAMAKK